MLTTSGSWLAQEKAFYSATLYGKETGNPFLYNKKDKKK